MKTELIGIYKITFPNKRSYIGLTGKSFKERWGTHLHGLKSGKHKNPILQAHFNKYGIGSMKFEILESWAFTSKEIDEKRLLEREQYWWDFFSSTVKLINGRPTGTGSVFHTKETRAKLSASLSKEPIKYICKNCNKHFTRPSQGERVAIFCSRTCNAKWRQANGDLFIGNSSIRTKEWVVNISSSMTGNKNAIGNQGGRITAHNRWHKNRNIYNEECEYCIVS